MAETQSFYIPPEIITAILLILPPRALMKFICVCKTWKSLITNPSFLIDYSKISTSKGMNSILYMPIRNTEDMSFNFISNASFEGPLEIEKIPFPFNIKNYIVVGCINGLFCFSDAADFGKTIYLFNPCIRKYRIIRSSNIELIAGRSKVLGFAYQSATEDYKIIRIHEQTLIFHDCIDASSESIIDFDFIDVQVEVYSMRTNSWKQIFVDHSIITWDVIYSHSGILVNECLHWFSNSKTFGGKVILSFDLMKEKFNEIGMPNFGDGTDNDFGDFLGVYKEDLSIFKYYPSGSPMSQFCYLWVMKQYGVESSWTKVYTIEVFGQIRKSLNFTTNGEILLEDRAGNVWVYNFDDQVMKFTGIKDEDANLAFVNYNASLLLLDNSNEALN